MEFLGYYAGLLACVVNSNIYQIYEKGVYNNGIDVTDCK